MLMRRSILSGSAVLFLVAASTAYPFGWAIVNAKIRHDFPEVPRISTAELSAWLSDTSRAAPLLLDVRTRAEYEVSHLEKAQQVEPDAAVSAVSAAKDRPIVTYCSVGYRSSAFARRLRAAGFADVRNLEGSIFRWANEGRPVFRHGARVERVHPYNRTWGLLLQRKYRAELAQR
jgi:rhodanese-related sulfurtransferase